MEIENVINKLEKQAKSIFNLESSGHDIYHLKRVMNLALNLQEKEGGDRLVIAIASFLHDIHRIMQKEHGRYCTPEESIPKIIELLKNLDISEGKKEKILHCIKFHEEYEFSKNGKTAKDIETLIVQDADNLDGMGAIGIARAFSYGSAYKRPIWIPDIPLEQKKFDETVNDSSDIHHFYSKLLRLKDNMNTETAKKMALKRHLFMEKFLKRFFAEWKGEI